ncbi:MAG: TIGR00266 family protein [Bradymonadales bacterium]|nr:TIGR00266 family protein [Bradymonadales bacterium]
MNIEIYYKPAHAVARVVLNQGESIVAESGAMVSMSNTIQIQTAAGGIMSGLKRMLAGESFFRNTFLADSGPGEVLLAPPLCGDLTVLPVEGTGWFIQSSSYLASTPGIEITSKLGGFKTFFAGEGVFLLKAFGQGQVVVGAYGGLERVDVEGQMIIDTGHLVAWQDTPELTYRVTKAGSGWIASWMSGEGLVCEFTGHGTVWIQSRNPSGVGRLIGRLLPPRKS